MQKLLIVESPTKARTISRMLGKDYQIIASMGHVRDLPEHAFGIDIANSFKPEYTDTPRSKQILKELRSAAGKADEIYLATDPDREGEAIAWHLKNALSETLRQPKDFHRITFHEITRQAVEQAIANRSDIDLNLVDAQQARRVLDRIVGYQVSPSALAQTGKRQQCRTCPVGSFTHGGGKGTCRTGFRAGRILEFFHTLCHSR